MRLLITQPFAMRTLRTYTRVAQKSHTCWRCPHPINPGEEYDAEVIVCTGKGAQCRLTVSKCHIWCPGDRYDDEEEPDIGEFEKFGAEPEASESAAA